jgi:uncharacterized delta-60 repeat protein
MTIDIYSQTATQDPAFGQNGMTIIANATDMRFFDFDANGNIIAVGYTITDDGGCHLTIAKTSADGIIDEKFGNNGLVKMTDYESSYPVGMKIADNSIIVVIETYSKVPVEISETIMMRFNENGTVDEDFGDNGKVNLNASHLMSLNLESDDFILIAKSDYQSENPYPYLIKYNYEGGIDESFGENGVVYLTNSVSPFCMKLLNDGSIIVAGTYIDKDLAPNLQLGVCKLTSEGTVDTDFANGGVWHKDVMQDVD